MTRIKKPFVLLSVSCLFVFSIMAAGCGDGRPKRVPVSGRVLIDGKPLTAGNVVVYPENDHAAAGKIGPDGRFQLTTYDQNDGCVLGKHGVTVIGSEQKGPNALLWLAPKKYTNLKDSGLAMEVTGPTDSVEFKLTWDGGKPFVENLRTGETGEESGHFARPKKTE